MLTMDEKRFTMLDRVLRPDLYLWMKESEERLSRMRLPAFFAPESTKNV